MVRMYNGKMRIHVSNIRPDEVDDVRDAIIDYVSKTEEVLSREYSGNLSFVEEEMYDDITDSEMALKAILEPMTVNVNRLYKYIEKNVSNIDDLIILIHV